MLFKDRNVLTAVSVAQKAQKSSILALLERERVQVHKLIVPLPVTATQYRSGEKINREMEAKSNSCEGQFHYWELLKALDGNQSINILRMNVLLLLLN